MMEIAVDTYVLYPVLAPLLGAFLTLIFSRFHRMIAPVIGVISTGIAALGAVMLLVDQPWKESDYNPGDYIFRFVMPYLRLTDNETIHLKMGLNLDALGVTVAVVASTLGFLIAIFSIGYMKGEEHWTKYWFFLQLFITGMELLVLAGDIILLYVGWETVGLCSFALIGHWHYKQGEEGEKVAWAGFKAFAVTRVGDIGLLSGLVMLYGYTGETLLSDISAKLSFVPDDKVTLILVLLFMGAIGKSAQFPFIGWLSSPDHVDIDAMQGPTTVSALIHAATMVKAGVYLMARMFLVFSTVDVNKEFGYIVGITAALTALVTALSAAVADDLKRILAYSTVSQLAYMFMGLSAAFTLGPESHVGQTAYLASVFHLSSHAVFKALLFLTVGAIIHGTGSRMLKDNTGLWERSKLLSIALIVGALSLMGFPLFSGFWSKEAILGELFIGGNNFLGVVFAIGALTACVTAFYASKLVLITVFAKPKDDVHWHKPDWSMSIVAIVLTIAVVLMAFMVEFLPDLFEIQVLHDGHLEDVTFHWLPEGDLWGATLIVLAMIAAGIALTVYTYGMPNGEVKTSGWLHVKVPGGFALYTWSKNGFYVDQAMTGLGKLVVCFAHKLRKIHTGDLNYNMWGLQVLGAFILGVLLIGGL